MGNSPEVKVLLTAEDTGVSAAMKELTTQLKTLKRQEDDTSQSTRRFGESTAEARGAAKLLAEDLDLKLNRHLAGVLANSSSLGPILSAAFPVAAAIGFFEVIKGGAEKFAELISDTFIFTEDQKKLRDELVKTNSEIVKFEEKHKGLQKEIALIGLDHVSADKLKKEWADKDLATGAQQIANKQKELAEQTAILNTLRAQSAESVENGRLLGQFFLLVGDLLRPGRKVLIRPFFFQLVGGDVIETDERDLFLQSLVLLLELDDF